MELRRGIVKAFDPASYTATVQVVGSQGSWLGGVPVARHLAAGLLIPGSRCGLIFFDPANPQDACLSFVYEGAPGAWVSDGMLEGNITGSKVASATTTARGTVELAEAGEAGAALVVQANDPRLSDARTPTEHDETKHSDINQALLTSSTPTFAGAKFGGNRVELTSFGGKGLIQGLGDGHIRLELHPSAFYHKFTIYNQLTAIDVITLEENGDLQISGTLSVDTMAEKTLNTGVTVEGVLIKDGLVDGQDISDRINQGVKATDSPTFAGVYVGAGRVGFGAAFNKGLIQGIGSGHIRLELHPYDYYHKFTIYNQLSAADVITLEENGDLQMDGGLQVGGALNHDGSQVGFYGTAPAAKQTVTGSRGGNAALASLLTALAAIGLITDSSSA